MKMLHKKIVDKYQDADELIELLVRYELIAKIEKAIKKIEDCLKKGQITLLPQLSSVILIDFNSTVHTIDNEPDRRKVQYLIADLFKDYLKKISILQNAEEIIKEINKALEQTCNYQEYDFKDLSSLIRIDKLKVLLPKIKNTNTYFYEWLGEPEELDEIAKDLADKRIIYSVKEFKRLFTPLETNITVRFNKNKLDQSIILFVVLKEFEIIKPRGTNGNFAPFVQHAVDNEYNFLIESKFNKEHEKIKKNKVKYKNIKAQLRLLITSQVKPKKTMDGQ